MGLDLRRLAKALLLAALLSAGAAQAGEERYDYDGLGRLIRVIDGLGRVTEYVYDPAGNLLQVIGGASAQAPVVNAVAPASIRRNRIVQMTISGSGLQGVAITDDDPAISFTAVQTSPTAVSFRMTVAADARLGAHALSLKNAAGTVSAPFEVLPAIDYYVMPNPLAVPPDNVARQFTVVATAPDTETVTFTASTANQAVARAGTSPITIVAGQTQATGTITGVTAGATMLSFSGPSLSFANPIAVIVYVTTDFANANVVHTRALGLVRGDPSAPATGSASGPVLTAPLGVIRGDPSGPSTSGTSGPVLNAPLGVIKGDPASYPGATVGPILSPSVGVEKP